MSEPPAPAPVATPPPPMGRSMRVALGLAKVLSLVPRIGDARAQYIVARVYAVLYLVRFHLSTQYARAVLGLVWVGLAPLLTFAVYLPIFLLVFKVRLPGSDSALDYALFCLSGLTVWGAVSDAINQGASCLVASANIVRHAPTPPVMLPVIKVVTSFVGLTMGIAVLLVITAFFGPGLSVRLILLPVAYLTLFVFLLGLALGLSVLSAYFHDLLQIMPTLLAIEFFAAPVTFAPQSAPGIMGTLVGLNPLAAFLDLFRSALFPWHAFAWSQLGLALLWAALAFIIGLTLFRSLEAGIRDVV
jgi:ABC-type polysaccharide/polyol phosphate export permease